MRFRAAQGGLGCSGESFGRVRRSFGRVLGSSIKKNSRSTAPAAVMLNNSHDTATTGRPTYINVCVRSKLQFTRPPLAFAKDCQKRSDQDYGSKMCSCRLMGSEHLHLHAPSQLLLCKHKFSSILAWGVPLNVTFSLVTDPHFVFSTRPNGPRSRRGTRWSPPREVHPGGVSARKVWPADLPNS